MCANETKNPVPKPTIRRDAYKMNMLGCGVGVGAGSGVGVTQSRGNEPGVGVVVDQIASIPTPERFA